MASCIMYVGRNAQAIKVKPPAVILIVMLSSGIVDCALYVATLQKWSVHHFSCHMGTVAFFSCMLYKNNGAITVLYIGAYKFSNFTWVCFMWCLCHCSTVDRE
jgi:hypothetical protein